MIKILVLDIEETAITMSVFVKDKAFGLLYADRQDHHPLDEGQFRHFNMIGNKTSMGLEETSGVIERKDIVNG